MVLFLVYLFQDKNSLIFLFFLENSPQILNTIYTYLANKQKKHQSKRHLRIHEDFGFVKELFLVQILNRTWQFQMPYICTSASKIK